MRRAVLFMGGGPLQEPACRAARELGLEVVLIDRQREPHCRGHAAEHFALDGSDVSGALGVALEASERFRIVGCHGNNDFALPAVAACNALLGLPGPDPGSVARCRYKPLMRRLLAHGGIPLPSGRTVLGAASDLPIEPPFVVKAAEGAGSVGVARMDCAEDWRRYRDALDAVRAPLVVEELVRGTHHDVQGVMLGGELQPGGVADRLFGRGHAPVPSGVEVSACLPVRGVYPSALAENQLETLYELIARAARALGIHDSPVKADVVWARSGPVVLEVGPRFHGEIVSGLLVPEATGERPIADWFAYLLERRWPAARAPRSPEGRAGAAVWSAILPERDRTLRSDARQRVEGLAGIRALDWRFGRTTGRGPYTDNREVRGLFVTSGASRGEALQHSDRLLEKIYAGMCEPASPASARASDPLRATADYYDALYARTVERWPSESVVIFVERNIAALQQAPVLDVGCGAGRHLLLLAQRGIAAAGLDPSAQGLAEARRWAAESGRSIRLLRGAAHALPFANGTFGGLLAWESLFYGDQADLHRAVREALRVLRPGAPFLMSFKSVRDYRVREFPELHPGVHAVEGGQWMAFSEEGELEELFAPLCDALSIETLGRSYENRRRLRMNLLVTGTRREKEDR